MPILDVQQNFPESPRVLRRFGHLMLIVAFLAATGGHWMILQTFAWSTMLMNNLRTSSVSEAVGRTFDGEHPCNLCKQIAETKQSEKKAEFPQLAVKKFEFPADSCRFVFVAPSEFRFVGCQPPIATSVSHQPPVPPPRPSAV